MATVKQLTTHINKELKETQERITSLRAQAKDSPYSSNGYAVMAGHFEGYKDALEDILEFLDGDGES